MLQGDGASIDAHMRGLISRHRLEDTFFVVDLGTVQRCYAAWVEAMPSVRPFYTVRWVLRKDCLCLVPLGTPTHTHPTHPFLRPFYTVRSVSRSRERFALGQQRGEHALQAAPGKASPAKPQVARPATIIVVVVSCMS